MLLTLVFMIAMVMYFALVYGMCSFLLTMLASPPDVKAWLEDQIQERKDKQMPALMAASCAEPVAVRVTEYEKEMY